MKTTIWDADQQLGVPSAPRGYAARKDLATFIKQASQPRTLRSLVTMGSDHLVILGAGVASFICLQYATIWLALIIVPVCWLLAGRAARGLECLVHEASHYNISRNRRINDLLADFVCAWPVLSQVAKYRKSHLVHHRAFGHATDPDRIRSEKLDLLTLDRSNGFTFARGIAIRLFPYVPGWWWAIGVDVGTVLRFVLWHSLFVLLPASIFLGVAAALWLWVLMWGIPVFFVLPVIRFIAEAAEHDYDERIGETQVIFKTTWSNVGWIHHWLFHPHNDGFHAVHHLYPSVPHHALPDVHARLMREDATFAKDALIRTRLTGEVANAEITL